MACSLVSNIATRLLLKMEPERAHELAINALALGLVSYNSPEDQRLVVKCMGLTFPNPIGLAAGFDKNARALSALIKLGFGHVECGTVTPYPQEGNERPRVFRLTEDRALINRLGFNGCGVSRFARRLHRFHALQDARPIKTMHVPIGVNVGINKNGARPLEDYPHLVSSVAPYADYITINLSSPNTPHLRDLQSADKLLAILYAIKRHNPTAPPIAVKLAPDLDIGALPDIIAAAIEGGAKGLVICNTTLSRPAGLRSPYALESGGLSGRPLSQLALKILNVLAPLVAGRLSLISCGGIETGFDVYQRLSAGADMVQVYSAFIYQGPRLLGDLKQGLIAELNKEKCDSLEALRMQNRHRH